jgi:hypothetical protein
MLLLYFTLKINSTKLIFSESWGKAVKKKFFFTMTAYIGQTQMTAYIGQTQMTAYPGQTRRRPTSAKPGRQPTPAKPGRRPTSAKPGRRPTSAKPGRRWTNCALPYGTPYHGQLWYSLDSTHGVCSDSSSAEMQCLRLLRHSRTHFIGH